MPEPLLMFLVRYRFGSDATLGRLSIDGSMVGYVVEDEDRGLEQSWTEERIRKVKVMAETAIPIGIYSVLDTHSPKYKRRMLLLSQVPGYRGIRIHSGNHEGHTAGCLIPGLGVDEARMRVIDSRKAVSRVEELCRAAIAAGREVRIAITRDSKAWANRRTA